MIRKSALSAIRMYQRVAPPRLRDGASVAAHHWEEDPSDTCFTIKNISYPLIDTLFSKLCFYSNCRVQRWSKTQTQVSRIGFLRCAAELGARFQIVCDCLFKC